MRERTLRVLVVAAAFLVSLAFLFPTDSLVRRALGRALPDGPDVSFARARLRPAGVWLEDVRIRDRGGATELEADRVRVRPSLVGLLREGTGLPATIDAELCRGTAHATITTDGTATAVALTWADADLQACPGLELPGGALEGRASGAARLRLEPRAAPTGSGRLEVAEPLWRGPGLVTALRAESAAVRWKLGGRRLALEGVDLRSPAFVISGHGDVALGEPLDASHLDLELDLVSLLVPGTPRRVSVGGTLARPEITVH